MPGMLYEQQKIAELPKPGKH